MTDNSTMTEEEVQGIIDAMSKLLERDTVDGRFPAHLEELFRAKAMERIALINGNIKGMIAQGHEGGIAASLVPLGSGEHGTLEHRFQFQFPTKPYKSDRESLLQAVDSSQGSIVTAMLENLTGMLNPHFRAELGRGRHLVGIGPDVRLRLIPRKANILREDGMVLTRWVMFLMELELTMIVGLDEPTAALAA